LNTNELAVAGDTEVSSQTFVDLAEKTRVDGEGLKHSIYLTGNIKSWWVHEVWGPVEKFFVKTGVHPNTITTIGFVLTCLSASLVAMNNLVVGGWLIFIAASFDFLDGRVARITNQQSRAGAFFDSVMDRYMDSAILFGLAVLFYDSWVIILVFLAFLGSMTTSYIRAKAESIGIKCSGGAMQRPERILYIGTGCVISGYYECLRYPFVSADWKPVHYPLVLALVFVALISNKVALQRFREAFLALKKNS